VSGNAGSTAKEVAAAAISNTLAAKKMTGDIQEKLDWEIRARLRGSKN
jgi:hypothetical protein